jgi:hypothetical protein
MRIASQVMIIEPLVNPVTFSYNDVGTYGRYSTKLVFITSSFIQAVAEPTLALRTLASVISSSVRS